MPKPCLDRDREQKATIDRNLGSVRSVSNHMSDVGCGYYGAGMCDLGCIRGVFFVFSGVTFSAVVFHPRAASRARGTRRGPGGAGRAPRPRAGAEHGAEPRAGPSGSRAPGGGLSDRESVREPVQTERTVVASVIICYAPAGIRSGLLCCFTSLLCMLNLRCADAQHGQQHLLTGI